ncbi:spore coat protein [Paenibacillus sp. R14(2021)]|uniref:spore coat protein n=1 Tax=Paenibacillus sp. R14(2021) TaxID=2859228 RepID=UPI001C611667|nr:spore coat protein [Paenibacillus sp. R14(2021)]
MYQQQGQAQAHAHALLSDEDLASSVLSDLKRVVGEYATAATESSSQQVRQLFTNLLNSTLQMQGQFFQVMEQNQLYTAASPVLRQEIDKQLKQNQQMEQKTVQLLQQLGLGQSIHNQQYQNQQHQTYQQTQPQSGQQQGQHQFYM